MHVNRVKAFVKALSPGVYSAFSRSCWSMAQYIRDRSHRSLFDEIYRAHAWYDPDSVSGPGSNLARTALIRKAIPELLVQCHIESILDIPCGDCYWASRMAIGSCRYIGADIVQELVARNSRNYGRRGLEFQTLDITRDRLPKVDMVLCRDCLPHFSFSASMSTLSNIKQSRAAYVLTTTFTDRPENTDIITGDWRPLNLQASPFNFPAPIVLINEGCQEASGAFSDKSLGLWRIADIPLD